MAGMSTSTILIYVLFLVGIFYLLLIRPQKKYAKTRENLLNNLRVQDRIVTAGGLCGTITAIRGDSVRMLIAENVEVVVVKTGIMSVDNSDDDDNDDDEVVDLKKG